ncbi:nucleotidyltransferase [Mycolicibacterium fortuitum]|uniref:Nucleotidyltransferase n=1 Tax=Mycolicibacterium fortuitum TaxID=1766 RepID=A0ABD6QBW2_MYCFO|nr:nucleotidyltransferase [Mycolicibacterium fortuitum]OMC32755.1 nucleotidyltransferase [Mycolicibacterium fortuitum]
MKTSEIFDGLLANLQVDNAGTIGARRDEITKVLNKEFRDLDSSKGHQLMVGSYGRFTAIRGISDLDMLYVLPATLWDKYKGEDGPSNVLSRTRAAIQARYPTSSVKVDSPVVVVAFQNFMFEVQPVFEQEDGSFKYPYTKSKSWKVTKPREEIDETRDCDSITNRNFRKLCKMARAWKNRHGVAMGGLLMDTLVYNFLQKNTDHHSATTATYDFMVRDFFKFLSEEDNHDHYQALGSKQDVKVKKRFQGKAKTAYELCLKAIDAEGKTTVNAKWKKVFGKPVPAADTAPKTASAYTFDNTEEFIEDEFPVDVRYNLTIDCTVSQNGFRPDTLRSMLARHVWLRPRKILDFTVTECDVPQPYKLRWKVLNRGGEAEKRNEIRGQIINEDSRTHRESTKFRGEHYVECYAIKNGVIVARDHIEVPIITAP